MHTHTPSAYHISLSGVWDHLWEKRTGIQAGSLNDWMLHKTSTVVSIVTLLIPGIDAISGIPETPSAAPPKPAPSPPPQKPPGCVLPQKQD
jgi:hypothetical protein